MIGDYVLDLSTAILRTVCTDRNGLVYPEAFFWLQGYLRKYGRDGTVFVVGNGGSAAIASHVAVDLCKASGLRATALNDASMLTCLGNDYGYHSVFAKQLEYRAAKTDMLVAISSSGKSDNIICAIKQARKMGMAVVTFTGFDDDNDMRSLGNMNFYTPSHRYGIVELAHHTILHAVTDELAHHTILRGATVTGTVTLNPANVSGTVSVIRGDDWTPTVETVHAVSPQ